MLKVLQIFTLIFLTAFYFVGCSKDIGSNQPPHPTPSTAVSSVNPTSESGKALTTIEPLPTERLSPTRTDIIKGNENAATIQTQIKVEEAARIAEAFCRKPNIGAQAIYNKSFDVKDKNDVYYYFDIVYGTLMGEKPTEKDDVITSLYINANTKSIYEAIEKNSGQSYELGKKLK